MARHERAFAGEHRTAALRLQLTPSERDTLERRATTCGASLSTYARELLFRRPRGAAAAKPQPNPDAKLLADELHAIGNNLNQIAKRLHSTGELQNLAELRELLALHKEAISRVLML